MTAHPAAAWRRLPTAARLRWIVGALVCAAVLNALGWALWVDAQPPVEPWKLVALLVLLPTTELSLLHVRYGHHQATFTWGEACVLVGLAMLSPGWLVLLSLPVVTLVHLALRRGPMKALCNGAVFCLSTSLAALVLMGLSAPPYGLRDVGSTVALLAAVATWSLFNGVVTGAVIATAQRRRPWVVVRENFRVLALVWAGNVALAGGVVFIAEHSTATLMGMPPLMALLYIGYRGYLSARVERDVWQQLEAATRELNVLDEDQVASAALRRATQLFRADRVELLLFCGEEPQARLYALDSEDRLACRVVPQDAFDGAASVATSFVEVGADGAAGPELTCLLTPLEGPRGPVGALRLMFDGRVRLSSRERQVLSTFAHGVSSTVLNAALYAEAREEASRHEHSANHDSLTGLANRALLHRRTEQALAADDGTTTALLLLDLDHFKEINDTLGHAAGDLLLQDIGARLQHFVRASDVVARLGGDEFALLLTGLGDPAEAGPVAEALLRLLADPVEFEDLRLSVEGSIGVACHPQDAGMAEELFRRADVAMYQAKSSRGSWLRYSVERDDSSVHRQALVAELRAALEHDQLVVHYQPQVDLETGLVVGAEALCRWEHPTRGMLPPSEFVVVAEESGLVRPFTLRVLDQAVAECVTWQADRPIAVAVNLSARSLLDRQLPADVAAVLDRHGLSPDRLILEITETTATSELEVVEGVLAELRRLGVEISVDDFGTGYSSLAFLQRSAVHELKVDQSFVAGMLHSANDLALVRATIQLAHSLGARSVAEGVEDVAMAAALRELGCDVAQGYWLSQPLPARGVRELLGLRMDVEPARVPPARIDLDSRRLWAVDSAVRAG